MADDPRLLAARRHAGSGFGALETPAGGVLLLGAVGLDARVAATAETLEGSVDHPDNEGCTWFLDCGPEAEVFARYAALLAQGMGCDATDRALRPRRGPRVWCSWYSYYRDITEGTLLEAVDGLGGLPFDVVQVDDGWQAEIGDWTPGPGFPGGMAGLARRIAATGFRPGLWLAPFIARPDSRLCRERPDWLLRDAVGRVVEAGSNWGGPFFALDVTLPAVRRWATNLVRRAIDWGYSYLKLDFLYAAALPGAARHFPGPGEAAYREALAVIREAAGDRAYLLACGAPILASLGLVDGIRIGPDTAPYWENRERSLHLHDRTGPGARNALSTSLHRLWLGSMVHTDPDVAFFRTRYNLLSPRRRAALRDLALIAGFKGCSDPPAWLDPGEREELRAFLEAEPRVLRRGRYRFTIDDREVDFAWVL